MREYNYKIKGVDYNVKIKDVEGKIANVEVNGIDFEVELENAVAAPKPIVRPAAAHSSAPAAKPASAASAAAASAAPAAKPAASAGGSSAGKYAVKAPLPGTINDIKVSVGQEVKKGQTVVVLEAMKMENNIDTERDGKVAEVRVQKGDAVMEGAVLVTIE